MSRHYCHPELIRRAVGEMAHLMKRPAGSGQRFPPAAAWRRLLAAVLFIAAAHAALPQEVPIWANFTMENSDLPNNDVASRPARTARSGSELQAGWPGSTRTARGAPSRRTAPMAACPMTTSGRWRPARTPRPAGVDQRRRAIRGDGSVAALEQAAAPLVARP